ncbi:hypothetical protein [Priestia flexa]|uniref:hypothetical protein n=1 Tax=Priestia flexa TaxID=86664 RepID=UPI00047305B4|nr:hypothetical protein [Priestia flexa]
MNKWRNTIEIKKYLSNDSSDQAVLKICEAIIPQLKYISRIENRMIENKRKNSLDEYFLYEFDDLILEFEWIKNSINSNEDPSEFEYENWCEALNNYLEQLYDFGDSVVDYNESNNQKEKFLWVS